MADAVPVKAEVEDGGSPMAMDDDIYEDAGDLEFYDNALPLDPFGSMYLTRVPDYVWEAWNKLDGDAEVQIGTIRQWTERDNQGNVKHRMRLLLRPDIPQHQGMPKEWELDLMEHPAISGGAASTVTKNTFLFSEQDLPGFRAKNKARAAAAAAGIPAHLLRQKDKAEKPEQNHGPRRRGRQEYFRKAIPKKTAIYGRIKHELNCRAVKNPESEYLDNMRALEAMKPKATVKFGDASKSGMRILGSTTIAGHQAATNYIKTAPAPITKAKKMEAKTARMPENDLLDLIFERFTEFRYWSLRSLRAKIPQPEAYLRATLEKIADLHRSGTFANNWELKPENRRQTSATEAVKASDVLDAGDSDSNDDDDDADLKMEDVL